MALGEWQKNNKIVLLLKYYLSLKYKEENYFLTGTKGPI
jgi:hypothetical protein